MLSGISAVTERVGLGRLTPRVEPPAVLAAALPRRPAPAANGHPRTMLRAEPTIQEPTIHAFDLQEQTGLNPPASPLLVAPVSERRMPAVAAEGPAAISIATDTDPTVYSPEFPEVVPPTAIRPQLPRVLPPGVAASDLNRIELTVLQDGLVESVKLVSGLRRSTVKDGMLLSAAKTWRFAPAMRAGVPVRYRKTIWIVAE